MSELRYDTPINEVAKLLDKSDRQVRRYVKEKRLKAKPVRIDGHIKLMFNKEEVESFRERFLSSGVFGDSGHEIIVDAQVIDNNGNGHSHEAQPDIQAAGVGIADSAAVKYVVDILKDQLEKLQEENRDLHYQLEQRSGQVGFLQAQMESLQQEIKALSPIPKEAKVNLPWYKRLFGAKGDSQEQEVVS